MGGCQSGGAGSFPRTKREVFGGTKIHLCKYGVKYLNFNATCLSFGAVYLRLSAIYLNLAPYISILAPKIEIYEIQSFLRVGGGDEWVPPQGSGISVGFRHQCRPPLDNVGNGMGQFQSVAWSSGCS